MQCASPCDRNHQKQRTTVTSQPKNGSVWATKPDERKPTCCTVVAWTSLLASCCLNDENTNSPIATAAAAAAAAHANAVQEAGISFRPANSTQMLVACGTCSWKCSISGQWHRNVLYFGFCGTIFRSFTTTQAQTPHTSKANRMQLPSNVWLCALNCWNVEWLYFNAIRTIFVILEIRNWIFLKRKKNLWIQSERISGSHEKNDTFRRMGYLFWGNHYFRMAILQLKWERRLSLSILSASLNCSISLNEIPQFQNHSNWSGDGGRVLLQQLHFSHSLRLIISSER